MIWWPHANRYLPPFPSAAARWWRSGLWLITLVNIFHFRSLSQMTTGCHWLKAIFLKGEPLLSIRWKWFLCLLGCHCLRELYWLGLNILRPQQQQLRAVSLLSISACSSGLPSPNGGRCSCAHGWQMQTQAGSDLNESKRRHVLVSQRYVHTCVN